MLRQSSPQRVGTTALTRTHFLLLYGAMLVAAAGNTALQSVMPVSYTHLTLPTILLV